jgi:phage repressor protein C with HTH and peptisase S24 domain
METVNSNLSDDRSCDDPEKAVRRHVAASIAAAGGLKELNYRTGIPRGTLEKYIAETSTPSLFKAALLANALGLTINELAGLGVPEKEEGGKADLTSQPINPAPKRLGSNAETYDHSGMVAIPRYEDVVASAGPGAAAPLAPSASSMVAFDSAFLREKGAVPDRCSVITARGDSMAPTIPDGSLLIVDHSQSQIANGYIMVINLGDDLLVKRVRRRLDGLIDLISDNQAYAPETIGPDTLQQLRIVGRVVYFCRTP